MGNEMIRCMGCMNTFSPQYNTCPHCGYVVGTGVENAMHMAPGSVLADRYILGRVVGFGGFGVTYIAWDKTLCQRVAIKEYLPSEFSTRSAGQTNVTVFSGDKTIQFQDGLGKFVDEAKRLAKFQNDNGIVRVFDSFEENNTAYIVMEYLEGETLAAYLKREGKIPADKAIEMIMPVIHALSVVHAKGIIHRDIAPDNVFLTTDGKVKLIDFGAARYATTTKSRSLTVIIKPGYSPEEQYRSRGDQGPHTDVYSVGAILYRMITGETPPDALERRAFYEKNRKEILKPIRRFTQDITSAQVNAICNAMNVRIEDRTPDMVTLAQELTSTEKVARRGNSIRKIDPLTWPLWAKIGIPAAIVAVIVLAFIFIPDRIPVPPGQTIVPDVVGKEMSMAEKKLKKSKLGCEISDKVENDSIPKNKILTEDPDAGEFTDIDSIIHVVISAGRGDRIVPNVLGKLFADAKKELEAIGFVVTSKTAKSSEAEGVVLAQSVGENETLEIGSTIKLTISEGPDIDEKTAVTIPKLVGKDLEAAKTQAENLKLSVVVKEYVSSSTVPEGQIMEQNPAAGTSGMTGDRIDVIVSSGEEKPVVPDVVGRTEAAAIELMRERGVKYRVEYGESTEVSPGNVYAQSVAAETEIDKDTTVVISVRTGSTTTTRPTTTTTTTRPATTTTTTKPPTTTTKPSSTGFGYQNPGSKTTQAPTTAPTAASTSVTTMADTAKQQTTESTSSSTTPTASSSGYTPSTPPTAGTTASGSSGLGSGFTSFASKFSSRNYSLRSNGETVHKSGTKLYVEMSGETIEYQSGKYYVNGVETDSSDVNSRAKSVLTSANVYISSISDAVRQVKNNGSLIGQSSSSREKYDCNGTTYEFVFSSSGGLASITKSNMGQDYNLEFE